jgi:serine/threonine-protein kinase
MTLPVTRIGNYEIIAAIGAGGMGEVYRAKDTKLGRDVALKILPASFTNDPQRVARFRREAQVLASLNHPHIAQIYGLEEANGTQFLVLELVDGESLDKRIAGGPVPVDEALGIAKQIAEALEAAHEKGIIHRDLKPANIALTNDGTVKVLDFGLAKAVEATSGSFDAMNSPTITSPAMMTGVGVILGTAAYMSPEQAKGRAADKRSDVWAFGCVLYEMVTGKRAFEGDDVNDTLAAVLRAEPDWTAVAPNVSLGIRTLIRRCLAKDRRQRVADLSVAQFVLQEPGLVGSTPDALGAQATTVRWKRIVPLAAAVLVVSALVLTSSRAFKSSLPPMPVARFSSTLPDGQLFTSPSFRFVAISPDGKQMVYLANHRLFVRSLSEFDAHPIPGTETSLVVSSPTFSPDGRSIAFFMDGAIKRVAVTGGAPVAICAASAPQGMTWDSLGVVFAQGAEGVFRCSPNGGVREQVAKVQDGERAQDPQLLPAGTALLFSIARFADGTSQWDKARIVAHTLKSGARKTLINGGSAARYLPTGHLMYATGGIMFAVPFDPGKLELIGEREPAVEGVRRAIGSVSGAAQLDVSTNGTLIYLPGPVETTVTGVYIVLADQSGGMTRLSAPLGPYVNVRASRDGNRLAVGSDDGKEAIVWIHDVNGTSAMRRLTIGGHNRFPIISADGRQVAFQSDREGDLAIFSQKADGTGPIERLTKAAPGEAHVPESWSPDAKTISFSVEKAPTFTLWTLSLADKKATPFGDVRSVQPITSVFSPDGRWVAYTLSPAGGTLNSPNRGVFIQPFPSTGAVYQVPKQSVDFHPIWAPGGLELLFTPSASVGYLSTVKIDSDHGVAFGVPGRRPSLVTADRLSLETRAHDILPDGRLVGLVAAPSLESGTGVAPQIRVVLSWFEELKARVPTK